MSNVGELASWFLMLGFAVGGLATAFVVFGSLRLCREVDHGYDGTDPHLQDPVIADWAEEVGYDLLSVKDQTQATDRLAAECGFDDWHRPGRISRVQVRDSRNAVHDGWVFVGGKDAGRNDFTPEFLEVAWVN